MQELAGNLPHPGGAFDKSKCFHSFVKSVPYMHMPHVKCYNVPDGRNKTHTSRALTAEVAPTARLGGDTNHTDYCRSRVRAEGGSHYM